MGSPKRGDTSEAKSGNTINVVHMSSTFAPSWPLQLFSDVKDPKIVIEKEVFICQWTKKKTGQGSGLFSEKKCKEGI